jgi:hypothetical protein
MGLALRMPPVALGGCPTRALSRAKRHEPRGAVGAGPHE